jgi:hypothetical protein
MPSARGLLGPGVEPDRVRPQVGGRMFERREERPADALAPGAGSDVHAPDLGQPRRDSIGSPAGTTMAKVAAPALGKRRG